jgi:hypothetical protein
MSGGTAAMLVSAGGSISSSSMIRFSNEISEPELWLGVSGPDGNFSTASLIVLLAS